MLRTLRNTCNGVERVERGSAHEVHRYVHQDSHRPRHKDSARDGDRPIPVTRGAGVVVSERNKTRFDLEHWNYHLRFEIQRPASPYTTTGKKTEKNVPKSLFSRPSHLQSLTYRAADSNSYALHQISLAGVVRDAEGLEGALRDIRPHQVEGCISRGGVDGPTHTCARWSPRAISRGILELLKLHLYCARLPKRTLPSKRTKQKECGATPIFFFLTVCHETGNPACKTIHFHNFAPSFLSSAWERFHDGCTDSKRGSATLRNRRSMGGGKVV